MPISYDKWSHLDDSDDDESANASTQAQSRDEPSMNDFFRLDQNASVKEIQETIRRMPTKTKEELLRHEKGGLLKRMMELDPNKEYEAGEIWGTKQALPAKPSTPPSAAMRTSSSAPKKVPAMAPSTRASINYSKFDTVDDDLADIDDTCSRTAATLNKSPAACVNEVQSPSAPAVAATVEAASVGSLDTTVDKQAADLEAMAGHRAFTFLRLPADCNLPIESQTAFDLGGGDVLPVLLAPLFKGRDFVLDKDTVARETAARLKEIKMMQGSTEEEANSCGPTSLPSTKELERQARNGVCEAWPLVNATKENDWCAVKLYIDEVGALRKRPRNARAEALAAAVGQPDVTIHGDAFVGRIKYVGKYNVDEMNVSFDIEELSHTSKWALQGAQAHEARKDLDAQKAMKKGEKTLVLASGSDPKGRYEWSQGSDDVEVRVLKGIPVGPTAKKRIHVSYGRGESLKVAVDGATVLSIEKLFDRISPDECSWCLDGSSLVVTMEKVETRPWVELHLPGLQLAP